MTAFKAYQTSTNDDETINIHDVEIFKLGRHKGFDYNTEWTGKALANFTNQKEDGFLPSVIIGHNNGSDEKPARGFMDNLKLDGEVVKADLVKIPQKTFEDLKERAYPHRSVEVNPDEARFTALALLGGTSPYHKLPIMEFGTDENSVVIDFAEKKSTTVQTFIFSKDKFKNKESVIKWLKNHNKKFGEIVEKDETFHSTQIDDKQIQKGSYATIDITEGIKAVIGKKKNQKMDEEFQGAADGIDLEEAIATDEKLQKFRNIFWKMMDFINNVMSDKDKTDKNKKKEAKSLLEQGTSLLGKEANKFKEGEMEFTEQHQQHYDEQFKEKYGMTPEELAKKNEQFQEDAKKRESEAHKSIVKSFCDKLKNEFKIAPALVDDLTQPFMESLDNGKTVKFKEEDKDVEKPQMELFQSLIENFVAYAKGEKDKQLFVPDDEMKGVTFDNIGDDKSQEKLHAKAVEMAKKAMTENPKVDFNEAYEKAIFSLTESVQPGA